MPSEPSRGRVAFAVVHGDPPEVFVAEDEHVLSRVLALELVAGLPSTDVSSPEQLQAMRDALLTERWADALVAWITETDTIVDVYPDEEIWRDADLDLDQASLEIRVSPLFRDCGTVPSERTEITEIVTGLATLGHTDVDAAVRARPTEVANVRPDQWERLERALGDPASQEAFEGAWQNGLAFLRASEALRERRPLLVEWKGPHGVVGDQAIPVDLRIDHVFLVSCKYHSKVLMNSAPSSLFDHTLLGSRARQGPDWYQQVARRELQALYSVVCRELGRVASALPASVAELTSAQRRLLKMNLGRRWPPEAQTAYEALSAQVAHASARRWQDHLTAPAGREVMLWRLLRIGSAPYYVLGVSGRRHVRHRILTPWDWRQQYALRTFEVWPDAVGQPVVRWEATVRNRGNKADVAVKGHVEIRWSHGRFAQAPEAKVYLDTPHHLVPGYAPLT